MGREFAKYCCFYAIFFISIAIQAQDKAKISDISPTKTRLGGTGQIFQTRFIDEKGSKASNLWADVSWEEFSLLAEQRNERELGAIRYQSELVEISYGHRYKSIPGFFFGKDPDFFSALTADQPIQRSAFLQFLPFHYSPGIFWLPDITGDSMGFSFLSWQKKLAASHSPQTKVNSLYTNFFREKISLGNGTRIYWTWVSEAIGTRSNYYGTEFLRFDLYPVDIFIEASTYKNAFGKLNQGRDSFQDSILSSNPLVSSGAIGFEKYSRLEIIDSIDGSLRETITGAQIPLWQFSNLAPVYRYREYLVTESLEDSRLQHFTRSSTALLQGHYKRLFWSLGREFRSNQDRTTEMNLSWRGNDWNLETSILFQKEGNQFRTPFLRYYGDDKLQPTLTDRANVMRFRFKTNFVDINVSTSERFERRGTLVYMNIQFLLEF
ncbi:MAG: hypothetical protein MH321_11660 [Leptospiraceae bacterium]|nr:hypothetical protein [Leptospiraceae bacterium]